MSYVADYEVTVLRDRLEAGDVEAGERLLAFCESEISRLAILRERVREGLAVARERARRSVRADVEYVEGEVLDGELLALEA